MKAIAIVWNTMTDYFDEVLYDVSKKAKVLDCLRVDFHTGFNDFISDIYPYRGENSWKLDYKINVLTNKYSNNEILILFLDIPNSDKIYIDRKNIYVYENIEVLKQFIREKYKNVIDNYFFDNVYHMTDDEQEYEKTKLIIMQYLINTLCNNKSIDLDTMFYISKEYSIKDKGKREKFWFADNMFMFKKDKEETFESYAELFACEIADILEIDHAHYYPINFKNQRGILTVNFLDHNEKLVEGKKIIEDFLVRKNINIKDINDICKYNNLEYLPLIIKDYCVNNSLIMNDRIISDLKKLFAYDMMLLQTDRNPYNWGIIVDENSNKIRLAPSYDNSNFMGMNKNKDENAKYNLLDYYSMPKVLLYDSKDSFFDKNSNILNKIDDEELIEIFRYFVSKLESINLDDIYIIIEKKYHLEIPEMFKSIINTIYPENLNVIRNNFMKNKCKELKNEKYSNVRTGL